MVDSRIRICLPESHWFDNSCMANASSNPISALEIKHSGYPIHLATAPNSLNLSVQLE